MKAKFVKESLEYIMDALHVIQINVDALPSCAAKQAIREVSKTAWHSAYNLFNDFELEEEKARASE